MLAASKKYCDELYREKLQPLITNLEAKKAEVRPAVQTVWRLGILSADKDIAGLLARPDLTPLERSRLYSLLASMGTRAAVETLLTRASEKDRDAATALLKAEPGALEWLLSGIPDGAQPLDERQALLYRTVAKIAGVGGPRADGWWQTAKPEDRVKELDRVRAKGESVLEYWKANQGAWR
jgi:hypothetical protein